MSRLRLYNDNDPSTVLLQSREHAVIASELAKVGVLFEQWQANAPVKAGDSMQE